jgi:hypothetical protein
MKLAIMQPYFCPYIGYFQLIKLVDKFVIYDDVNYINKGWINRNNILVNSNKFLFQIPLVEASQNKKINTIEIFIDDIWKNKFLKTLIHSYKNAPHFDNVMNLIEGILNTNVKLISELNYYSILKICEYLDIKTEIVSTSSIFDNHNLKGQNRILSICKKLNSNHYINPIGGVDIYDPFLFLDNGIKINFITHKVIVYKQFKNLFVPNLSIIDVMMFNKKEEINNLLDQYSLI